MSVDGVGSPSSVPGKASDRCLILPISQNEQPRARPLSTLLGPTVALELPLLRIEKATIWAMQGQRQTNELAYNLSKACNCRFTKKKLSQWPDHLQLPDYATIPLSNYATMTLSQYTEWCLDRTVPMIFGHLPAPKPLASSWNGQCRHLSPSSNKKHLLPARSSAPSDRCLTYADIQNEQGSPLIRFSESKRPKIQSRIERDRPDVTPIGMFPSEMIWP